MDFKKIKKSACKVKNDILIIFTGKRIILNIVLIVLFFYFQKGIENFIESYLAYDGTFSNELITFLFVVSSVIIAIGLFCKVIIDKYIPTINQINSACLLLSCLLYFKSYDIEKRWIFSFYKFYEFRILYVNFIIWLLILYLIFNFIRYIRILFLLLKENDIPTNQLLNDDPINFDKEEILNYRSIIDKTTSLLLNENHKKSLTIGLVGPWGNGKSSVLNLIKKKIKESEKKDIITINFQPYLNHKEDDIINEFFISLSNELSKYNGKLSDILVEYSQKVNNLYENKNIFSLIEEHVTNFKDATASELYETINSMLAETNKKIIVFVDDLDRLNEKEILQILKLIRNTADFRNTIFLVAMDKQYVLSRLKDSSKILDTSFVDKFFQLEIYLPEIDKNDLRKYFIEELNKPFENMPIDFKDRVDKALNDNTLLFDDYIKNFRDIKRTVNQIRFDLSLFKEDYNYLNLKDFINFTFFKLKFPKVMEDLKDGQSDFLELDASTGLYNLIKNKPLESTSLPIFFRSQETYDIIRLKDYKVFELLSKDNSKEDLSINYKDKKLLVKALAFLFGSENTITGMDSIKHQSNFRMLMQQRIFENHLTHSQFNALLTLEKDNLKNYLNVLKDEKKISQLVNRLEYYRITNANQIKTIIATLLLLYENNEVFDVNSFILLRLLHLFVTDLSEERDNNKIVLNDENISWIKENIFENDELSLKTRLELLANLWESKHTNNLWSLDDEYTEDLTVKLFKEYLNQFSNDLWGANDYNIYRIYHDIKSISFKKINDVLKDFWKKNKIELLCAQVTEVEPNYNFSCKISDVVIEFFGSKEEFIRFVENHKDNDKPGVKEFLELFYLLQITVFTKNVLFNFEKSDLMLAKIEEIKSNPQRKINKSNLDIRQVFFESDDKNLIEGIYNNQQFFKTSLNIDKYNYKDKFYLVVNFHKDGGTKDFVDFLNSIYKENKIVKLSDFKIISPENIYAEEIFIQIRDEYYFKSISIQPKFNLKMK
ncbi:KAP family P-loop NTPase fold protein [Flavobacterium sp.]|uniref:KAP family P-loop NTPase fold protein n=1 Tax=Flavobacterium sp. TaxID=239 RepID=UPI0040486E22